MKNFKQKPPLSSYSIANPSCRKTHKPGQNQLVTTKTCILNLIKLLGNVNPFTFLSWRYHQ
jgi:hypothetical protein